MTTSYSFTNEPVQYCMLILVFSLIIAPDMSLDVTIEFEP